MPQQNQQVLAYILHSKPYLENSLILQLFSLEIGCFSVIAKGVKSKKSQSRKAILQPFLALEIEFTGRSDLKTLLHCELSQQHFTQSPLNTLHGRSLACGFYANELIIRACSHGHEFPELFYQYQQLIEHLKASNNSEINLIQKKLRDFEVILLTSIGLAPDWFYDTEQRPIELEKHYQLLPEIGFQLAEPMVPYLASDTMKSNDGHYQGQTILSLASGEQIAEYSKSYQQITAILLRDVIGNKPLQSRKLWQQFNLIQ